MLKRRGGGSKAIEPLFNRVNFTLYDIIYLGHNPLFHWLIKNYAPIKYHISFAYSTLRCQSKCDVEVNFFTIKKTT